MNLHDRGGIDVRATTASSQADARAGVCGTAEGSGGHADMPGPIDKIQRWAPGEARREWCEGSSRPTGRPTPD